MRPLSGHLNFIRLEYVGRSYVGLKVLPVINTEIMTSALFTYITEPITQREGALNLCMYMYADPTCC